MFFLPVILLFLVFYFFLLGGLFFFLKIGLISLAFQRLGLPPDLVFALLLLSLVGSGLNIPLKRIRSENLLAEQVVEFFGWAVKTGVYRGCQCQGLESGAGRIKALRGAV